MSRIQQKNIESSQSPKKEGNAQQYNKNNGIEYQSSGQKQNAKVQSMTIDSNVSPSQIQNSNSVLRSSLQQDGPNIQREKSSNNQSSVQATNFNNQQLRNMPGQQTQNRDTRTPSKMPVQKDFNENLQQIAKNQNVSNAIQLQKTQQEVINKNRKNKKSLHEDIMEEQDTDRNIQEDSAEMNFPSYRDFVDEKERPTERKFMIKDQASYQPSNTRIIKKLPGQRDKRNNDDQSFDSYDCDIGGQSLDQQNIAQNKPNQDLIMPKTVKQRENELQLFQHEQRDAEIDNESLEEQRLIKNGKSPSTNFKQKTNLQYDLNGNLLGKQRPSTDLVSKQKTNNDDQIWSVRSQIESGFQYKFIGQDYQEQTEYESGIKMYGEQDQNKSQVQEVKSYKHQLFKYDKQDKKYRMNSKNDAMYFEGLKNRQEIDNQIFEYYAKNTYIRNIDIDEDPQKLDNQLLLNAIENKDLQNDQSVLKEVKNVHICSDHQRAYVWIVTWVLKFKQKTVHQSQKKQLWLQVYNLASSWQSHSSLQKEKIQTIQKIEQLKLDILKLQSEIKSQSTALQQQYQLQRGQMVQMVHQNKEIQAVIDNARKGVNNQIQQKKEQLKLNIKQLNEFENLLQQDLAFFNPQSSPDVDSESQCFNQIDGYESVQTFSEEDAQRQSVRTQAAQKAEFSIFIGEFSSQNLDYMHDQIQSFYKQFTTSEDALYFFMLDNKSFVEKVGSSSDEQTMQYTNSVKNKISDEARSISQFDKNLKPFLYKLSAFSCQPQKVIINDKPVFLPTDEITNQFSIIRTVDPSQSKSFSTEDRFLFALLKEVQIQHQPDHLISLESKIASERSAKQRQSLKKKQLQPKFIESQIEIYHNNTELPIISFNFNLRQIPPKYDPKNISAFHKNGCDSDEDEEKPVNQNVQFCSWYLANQENKEINIQIVLNHQILNIQTSIQTLLLPQTEQKSILISKNHSLKQSKFYENKDQFLYQNMQIDQQTPIFRIKLDKNLGENKSFKDAAFRAKQIWENDLINLIEDQQKNQVQNENIIYSKKQFLEQLCEQQSQILQGLSRNIDHIYIFCLQKENKLYFQSLNPIIPDYMWACNEGLQLRSQIFNHLKQRFQISNSQVDFVDSFRFEYEDINQQLYMIDNKNVSQFSRAVQKKENLFKEINDIRQSIFPHQIFNKCQKVYFCENQNFYDEQCNCSQDCQKQEQKYFDIYEIQNQQKSIDAVKQLIKSNPSCISKQAKNILDHMNSSIQDKKQKENLISKLVNKSQVDSQSPTKKISQRQQIYNKAVGNSENQAADDNKSPQKKKDTLKTKFIMEKLVFSQDMKQFIYTIKSRNKYCVHNQNENEERKRISFRGNQYSFDEDFEFYEYQIIIGQIDIQFYQHMVHSNEEKDPFRITQQSLSQFLMFDGITEPICNPQNPYQNLFMMQDQFSAFDSLLPQQLKSQNTFDQMNGEDFDQDEQLKIIGKPKLKVFQTFQKISQIYSEININENQPILRNLPNQLTFINFQYDSELRKNYFLQKLMQNNFLRNVEWLRMEQDVLSYQDFLNEQSLAKVWYIPSKASINDQYQIRTVDILEPVFSQHPKFNPNPSLKIDQNQLMPYDFLIQLFFNQMSIVTLKQQKQNPQNVIFVLRPNNIDSQIQNDSQMFQKQNQQIYILGKLDKSFYNLESVQVIRQSRESIVQSNIYERELQPFQFQSNLIESIDLADYVKELYDQQNKNQSQIKLDNQCKNLNMVTFDSNFGDSYSENLEIFAVKMWSPINSVKIFLYDYINKQTIDLYELPLDEIQNKYVQNIQLVRISDEELTYALLLDGNQMKEIYLINFINTDESLFQDQIHYKGWLFGKYDLINQNLENSCIQNLQHTNFILNQQVKMVPLYKQFPQNKDINILERDGFTVIIDQVRLDFDYKYFSNINGRERIRYNMANQSNVFQYEVKLSHKIKRNINQETHFDFKYFQFQIVKIKLREEILLNNYFNENQKLKILNYFSKVAALISEPNFQVLIQKTQNQKNLKVQNLDISLQQQIVQQYLQPRYELFGASYLSFLSEEPDFLKVLLKQFSIQISNNNHNNQKFCELDMNLMSPITWNIHNNQLEIASILINFQNQLLKNQSKDVRNQNSVIYYGYYKKLLNTKMIESLDIQDQIFGYEVMEQSLQNRNLPKYELKSENFQNDYERNINLVERYMQQALLIDKIQKPNFSDYLFKKQNDKQLQEVQYSFIDTDWINILNIFNQNPLPLQKQINLSQQMFVFKTNNLFDYNRNYNLLQSSKDTFMNAITKHQNFEIFRNKELQNLIDYHWMSVSENYYQFQLWIFVLFFMLPLGVDIYYLWNYVFIYKDLTLAHQMFMLLALICQFVYFIKEIIDMAVKRISADDFFSSLWHINGILSFPLYLVALVSMWAFTVSGSDFNGDQIDAIRILYMIVVVQTFFRFFYLARVYQDLGVLFITLGKIISDVKPIMLITLSINIMFGLLFLLLGISLGDEYNYVWAPIKWLAFALRNGLHDFSLNTNYGMLPLQNIQKSTNDAYAEGRGLLLHMAWVVWFANVIVMTLIIFNLLLAIIIKSYNSLTENQEALMYQQKAEMINESQQVMMALKMRSYHDFDKSVIVRNSKRNDKQLI